MELICEKCNTPHDGEMNWYEKRYVQHVLRLTLCKKCAHEELEMWTTEDRRSKLGEAPYMVCYFKNEQPYGLKVLYLDFPMNKPKIPEGSCDNWIKENLAVVPKARLERLYRIEEEGREFKIERRRQEKELIEQRRKAFDVFDRCIGIHPTDVDHSVIVTEPEHSSEKCA